MLKAPHPYLLAFDIETLGLLHEIPLPEITCVCMYDGERDYVFRLWKLPSASEYEANMHAITALLDGADRIAGYNAVLFDLEFLRRSFGVPDEQMRRWVLKCLDPFLFVRSVLGEPCRLQRLLELNGLGSKTGTGGNAIALARDGQWDKLLSYCSDDARLTFQLCTCSEWVRLTPALECSLLSFPPCFRLRSSSSFLEGVGPTAACLEGEASEEGNQAGSAMAHLSEHPWPKTETFASITHDSCNHDYDHENDDDDDNGNNE